MNLAWVFIFTEIILISLLLTIDLDVSISVVNEQANVTRVQSFALLYPYDLLIVVYRFHTIAIHPHTKVSAIRHFGRRESHFFKVILIQPVSCAS